MLLGRSKGIVKTKTRGNTRENQRRGIYEHVTGIQAILEAEKKLDPLVVLSGRESGYRKWKEGKFEKPSDTVP